MATINVTLSEIIDADNLDKVLKSCLEMSKDFTVLIEGVEIREFISSFNEVGVLTLKEFIEEEKR